MSKKFSSKKLKTKIYAYRSYIDSESWRKKRREVFAAYGRICDSCRTTSGELHIHHKTYENFQNEKIEDLVVLCKACHMKLHGRSVAGEKKRKQKKKLAKKQVKKTNCLNCSHYLFTNPLCKYGKETPQENCTLFEKGWKNVASKDRQVKKKAQEAGKTMKQVCANIKSCLSPERQAANDAFLETLKGGNKKTPSKKKPRKRMKH